MEFLPFLILVAMGWGYRNLLPRLGHKQDHLHCREAIPQSEMLWAVGRPCSAFQCVKGLEQTGLVEGVPAHGRGLG